MMKEHVVQSIARVGAKAPCDVHVPKGVTNLEPGQTSFFQALNIHTKIFKSNIEILNDVHLIKEGEKVGPSEATLLQKLNIKPFYYGLVVCHILHTLHSSPSLSCALVQHDHTIDFH